MKPIPLLPFSYKWPSVIAALVGAIIGIAVMYFDYSPDWLQIETNEEMPFMNTQNLIDEVALSLILVGLLGVAFSRERIEDEFVNHIRLHSLLWSFALYYALVFISVWVFYDDQFWSVMIYHLFMPVLFYVVLFRINYMLKMKN